jgi:hypothetical protein
MQSRSAFYAVGGMIPPLVLQRTESVERAACVCALLCLSSCVGGSVERLLAASAHCMPSQESDVREADLISENTPLTQDHSDSGSTFGTMTRARGNSNAHDRTLESIELAALEELLSPSCPLQGSADGHSHSGGRSSHVDDVVHSVLSRLQDSDAGTDIDDMSPSHTTRHTASRSRSNSHRSDSGSGGTVGPVTLSFASASIVDALVHHPVSSAGTGSASDSYASDFPMDIEHEKIVTDIASSIALIPNNVKNMLTIFLFLFCTFSASFVGWFPTFCAVRSAEGESIPHGLAARTVSIYFFFMSWGCIASIPFTIWVPNRTMIRFHLALIAVGVALFQISVGDDIFVNLLYAASGIMGYGVSSIFPLTMTMANDYGFTA